MKAILEFNLPKDKSDYETASNASNYYCALWDIYQMLREKHKYGNYEQQETTEIVGTIYTSFWNILEEANVKLDQ